MICPRNMTTTLLLWIHRGTFALEKQNKIIFKFFLWYFRCYSWVTEKLRINILYSTKLRREEPGIPRGKSRNFRKSNIFLIWVIVWENFSSLGFTSDISLFQGLLLGDSFPIRPCVRLSTHHSKTDANLKFRDRCLYQKILYFYDFTQWKPLKVVDVNIKINS